MFAFICGGVSKLETCMGFRRSDSEGLILYTMYHDIHVVWSDYSSTPPYL